MTRPAGGIRLSWPGRAASATPEDVCADGPSPPASSPVFQRRERYRPTATTPTITAVSAGDETPNRLVFGDNLATLRALLPELTGRVTLIYIDPPFATGGCFTTTAAVGEDDGCGAISRPSRAIARPAYDDRWNRDLATYLQMMESRLSLLHQLLAPNGTLYLHVDHRAFAHLRVLADEIFGVNGFRNMITWRRQVPRGMKAHARCMPHSADYLLIYSRSSKPIWNELETETLITVAEAEKKYLRDERGFFRTSDPGTYSPESLVRLFNEGRLHVTRGGQLALRHGRVTVTGGTLGVKYYREQRGDRVVERRVIDNIWDDIPGMGVVSGEYWGYPTQKPERLLERIISASSNPGDLVLDAFCGSGTTVVVADRLGRRWVGCDCGHLAIETTRRRLLSQARAQPFVVANCGVAPGIVDADSVTATPASPFSVEANVHPNSDGNWVVTLLKCTGAPPPQITAAARHQDFRWSDLIDAWSVSWGDAAEPGTVDWWSFRTRRHRRLELESAPHEFARPGTYTVCIRALDVHGNPWEERRTITVS